MLDELCADGACAGITANPVGDIASLAAQLRKRALSGSVYDGSGKRHASTLDEQGLLDILEAGDLNPALRALLPAAVRSALAHDPDPLLRLHAALRGPDPERADRKHSGGEPSQEIDEALFATTSCEESPFPWQRSAPPSNAARRSARLPARTARQRLLPVRRGHRVRQQPHPRRAPAGPTPRPRPRRPEPAAERAHADPLRRAGPQDADGRRAAASPRRSPTPSCCSSRSPGTPCSAATSATAPRWRSRRSSRASPCSRARATADQFAPTPITPTKLAHVRAPAGLGGRPGRTLVAVLDTLVDLNRQVIARHAAGRRRTPERLELRRPARRLRQAHRLHGDPQDFSLVPGVQLTATFPVRDGELQAANIRVSGKEARRGTVRFGATSERVTGALAGRALRREPRQGHAVARRAAQSGQANGPRSRRSTGCSDDARRRPLALSAATAGCPRPGYPEPVANALAQETSPYLRQHAENPVDWLPWGPAALARARAEDKPLLVSIGYSACHWCHVMERESFEDPRTAAADERELRVREGRSRGAPGHRRASTWRPCRA